MTTAQFENFVEEWIATAKHPTTGRRLTEMVYQPMIELLAYLRANPALAMPVPLEHSAVPVTSLQSIAPRRSEAALLNAGRLVESAVKE